MINWIMTVIGLILLVAYYQLLGSSFFIGIKIKRNRFAFNLISGFILTWALGWIIGFPCELFSTSWNLFAIIFTVTLIVVSVIALFIQFKFNDKLTLFLKKDIKDKFKIIGKHLVHNLSEYWFVYLFVIIFSALSITNMQPYTLNNYNDDHYIVRVLHLYKSNALFNEDYYTGNILQKTGMFSYALQQGQRMFNTYELIYSYIGSILHINLVFFCRVTMTAHNYLIIFMLYTLFASIFLRAKYSQFGILCFSILIIPAGYLAKANIPIRVRMWENWRFQTAIYMGGSIVRVCSFPMMIYYLYAWFYRKSWRGLLIYPIIGLMLLSFQTTAISYVLLFIPILILAFILYFLWEKIDLENKDELIKAIAFSTACIILFAFLFIMPDGVLSKLNIRIPAALNIAKHTEINTKVIKEIAKGYHPYYKDAFTFDFFARFALIPMIFLLVIGKDTKVKIIALSSTMLYLIFAFNHSTLYLGLISFESYCIARMLTGIQLLIMIYMGILFISFILNLPYKHLVIPVVCCSLILSSTSYLIINRDKVLKYTSDGDAIVKSGFSLIPIQNKMISHVFRNIGNYFNENVEKKTPMFSEDEFWIKGVKYTNSGFLMASKRITNIHFDIYSYYFKRNKSYSNLNMAYWVLNSYMNGLTKSNTKLYYLNYSAIEPYLKKANLKYIFVTKQDVKNDLKKNRWKVVVTSNNYYWLMKAPY